MRYLKPIYELFDKKSNFEIINVDKHHIKYDEQFFVEYLIKLDKGLYKMSFKYLDKMLGFDFSIVEENNSNYHILTNKFNLYDILSVSSELFNDFKNNSEKTGENYIVESLIFDPIKEKDETNVSPLNTKRGKIYDYYIKAKLKNQKLDYNFSFNNVELIYDLKTPIFLKDLNL